MVCTIPRHRPGSIMLKILPQNAFRNFLKFLCILLFTFPIMLIIMLQFLQHCSSIIYYVGINMPAYCANHYAGMPDASLRRYCEQQY